MILLALAAVVLATFVPLVQLAAAGNSTARTLATLEAAVFVLGTGVAAFVAFVFFGLKCDESCDENVIPEARAGTWWHTLDAPQWSIQLGVAASAFFVTVAAFGLLLRNRHGWALAAVVVALCLFCAWALVVAPLGDALWI